MVRLVIPELTGAAVRRRSVEVVAWSHPPFHFGKCAAIFWNRAAAVGLVFGMAEKPCPGFGRPARQEARAPHFGFGQRVTGGLLHPMPEAPQPAPAPPESLAPDLALCFTPRFPAARGGIARGYARMRPRHPAPGSG